MTPSPNTYVTRLGVLALVLGCVLLPAPPLYGGDRTLEAPEEPTSVIRNGQWIELDAYLKEHPRAPRGIKPRWSKSTQEKALLPSLSGQEDFDRSKMSGITDDEAVTTSGINFPAMPPLFERRKIKGKEKEIATQKPKPAKPPAPPVKAIAKAPTPVKAPPQLSPKAAAAAGDRATLDALRKAVEDLKLGKELDFLTAPPPAPLMPAGDQGTDIKKAP